MVILFRKPENYAGPQWKQKFVLKGRNNPGVAEWSYHKFAKENPGVPYEMRILKGDTEYTMYEYRRKFG